ncbi:antitoxin Xre/MbcA/ParS toxin-binding domain-containing protein [Aeromonas hydrophila]
MNVGTMYKPKASVITTVSLLSILSLPKQPADAHIGILAGLPSNILSNLSSEIHVDEMIICEWVGICYATYRRKNKEYKKALSVEHGCKIYMLVKVLDATIQLFNRDISVAIKWLDSPARALDGERPLHFLSTPIGAEAILDLIGQIEHGVIS